MNTCPNSSTLVSSHFHHQHQHQHKHQHQPHKYQHHMIYFSACSFAAVIFVFAAGGLLCKPPAVDRRTTASTNNVCKRGGEITELITRNFAIPILLDLLVFNDDEQILPRQLTLLNFRRLLL